jgi:hypothetical protein
MPVMELAPKLRNSGGASRYCRGAVGQGLQIYKIRKIGCALEFQHLVFTGK